MAGAEGVVDVSVCQAGELGGERRSPFFSPLLNRTFSRTSTSPGFRAWRPRRPRDRRYRSTFLTGRPSRSWSLRGDLVHPERSVGGGVAGGPAEMADEDQARALIEGVLERRQRGADPSVVGDLTVLGLRHVEIDPDENLLAGQVEVANRLLGQERGPGTKKGNLAARAARRWAGLYQ